MASPTRFGRYQVLEPIGQGAMGAVYKALDPAIDRVVAVKTVGGVLLALAEHREEFLERFRREARAAGRLSHPSIVSVYDLGVDEATSTPFIVMEYVPGVSLATVLKENPALPLDQGLDILEEIASALEEAHRNGIVHRDIKPGNILLDARGRVKVGDFGIARMEDSDLTQTGVGLGTPGYLAPEVLKGAKAEARADVFALGVVAYFVLTGRKPFAGDTRDSIALQVLQHEPEPPHVVRPELPQAVSEAVMRALAKSPEERTPSAAAFREALRAARAGVAAHSPTVTSVAAPPAAEPAPGARRKVLVVAAILGLALMAGGLLLALRPWGEEPAAASPPPPTPRPRVERPATPRATPAPTPTPAPLLWPSFEPQHDREGDDRKQPPGKGKGRGKGKKKGH